MAVNSEFLELLALLATQCEGDRLHLPKVIAGLVLGHGEGHGSTSADPVPSDLSNAARGVPQAVGDGVAATIHRTCCGGGCSEEGLDLRLQD